MNPKRVEAMLATVKDHAISAHPTPGATNFELKPGAKGVPCYGKVFYDSYRAVGQFPGVTASERALKTRLTKAFFGPAEPII
jgi:hypothetical protein